jgi:flagellar FliJ protein
MAVFRFRLASVLSYRERIKEERLWELHPLEEAKAHLASEMQRLEQLLIRRTQEAEDQQGKVLSLRDFRLHEDFTQRVIQRMKERSELLTAVQKRLEAKRAEVIQADRDVKTLEQLRDRWKERHRQQEAKSEQQTIDEIGQGKYLHADEH